VYLEQIDLQVLLIMILMPVWLETTHTLLWKVIDRELAWPWLDSGWTALFI